MLEGGEGTRQEHAGEAARARGWRNAAGRRVLTHEPGDTRVGEEIRALLLHEDWELDARAELLLMLADRAAHVTELIRPALAAGKVVVSDRFTPSTLAYQGVGRALGVDAVERLSAFAAGGLEPDLVVMLDLPDDIAARSRRCRPRPHGTRRVRVPRRRSGRRTGRWRRSGAGRSSTRNGARDDVAARLWAAVEPVL